MKNNRLHLRFTFGLIAWWGVALTADAALTTNSWTNSVSSVLNKWELGINWSLGVPPTNSHAAILITNVATKTVTIDATTVLTNAIKDCMTISNLTVRGFGAGINTLQLTNAGVATPLRIVSDFTLGTNAVLLVTNSILRVDALSGGELTIDGTATLNTGSIVVTNSFTTVSSTISGGKLTVSNGTWLADGVFVGRFASSQGTLTLAGGTNTLAFLDMGRFANGTGTVWVTGGQLTVTNDNPSSPFTIVGVFGIGRMTVSNGTWLARLVTVGHGGTSQGTLTIAGGTNTVSSDFLIGRLANATGTVFVTGGQLVVTNAPMVIGSNGVGQVTQSGGTMLASNVTVGTGTGSQGTFTVAGGTITLSSFLRIGDLANATGTVWLTGGQLTTTNFFTSIGESGVGRMTVSNGTWLAQAVNVAVVGGSQGTLTLAGGSNTLSLTLTIGELVTATGTVWMTGGELEVKNGNTYVGGVGVGRMTVSNGTWLAQSVYVGEAAGSQGTLTVAGGTNQLSGSLFVGALSSVATGAVWVTGGQLTVTNDETGIGYNGLGRMTVSNGTWLAQGVYVGHFDGSQGTLTVADDSNVRSLFMIIGKDSTVTGTVWLTGGQLTVTNANTDIGFFGVGRMTVSNGTWLARDVYVARSAGSQGTLTLAGGTNTFSSSFSVGFSANATGAMWVTGGQLTSTNGVAFVGGDGGASVGQMTVSNGTWLAKDVDVSENMDSQGTLTVAGGTTTLLGRLIFSDNGTGTVWLTGGQLTVTNSSVESFGVGRMTVSNGTWRARDVFVALGSLSQGTLTVAGGTSSVFSNMTLGNSCGSPGASTGIVNMTSGELRVTNTSVTAVLEVRSGTLTQSGGVLDIDRLVITNSCARFIHTGGLLTTRVIEPLPPGFDADGDGLPNGWEQSFGLDAFNDTGNNGASGDPDGDGQSNLAEFLTGTDPTNSASFFRIDSFASEGMNRRVVWTALGGTTNRLQILLGSAFVDIGPPIIISGTGLSSTNYLDVGANTNQIRAYRVRLVP